MDERSESLHHKIIQDL
jgi:hypothetical protein